VNHWLGSGFYQACRKHGLGLVLGAMTIRYRRSLNLFQIVQLRTKVIFWDEKALYLEQQFVNNNGFVCAVAIAKQSMVQRDKRKKDHVTVDQVIHDVMGEQVPTPYPPKELELWIDCNSASSLSLRGSCQVS
jgi:acyl-CoA thioesterase FadM